MPYTMPLDHCKCYAWACINFEKVKDTWVKDERKIDGYAVERKKMQRETARGNRSVGPRNTQTARTEME